MKYKSLLFIDLVLLATIISCKKNDESNPANNNVLTMCDIKYIKYSGGAYEWKYTFDNEIISEEDFFCFSESCNPVCS